MTELKRPAFEPLIGRFDLAIRLLLLAGPDEGLVHALAGRARAALADPADPMAVVDVAAEALRTDPGRLADEAASGGLFGAARVIRVEGATEWAVPAVQLLLETPAAGNPVVMTAGDLPKNSGLRKLAAAHPAARSFILYAPGEAALARGLVADGRALGLRFEPGVAERLAAGCSDVGVLAQELEKFALYLAATPAAPRPLTGPDVALLGAGRGEDDRDALIQALLVGDRAAIGRQFDALPDGEAIGALRQLGRRLMQLADARAALDAGRSAGDALAAARLFGAPAARDAMAAALRAWPRARIEAALGTLLAAEAAIKAPESAGDVIGRQALARTARRAGAGRPA